MALKIIHDSFSASEPVQRGPYVVVAFQDYDTEQEDAFMFGEDAFKKWATMIYEKAHGVGAIKPATLQDVKDLSKEKPT